MPERLPQHKHCLSCGKAISPSKEYCNDECKQTRIDLIKKKRRQLLMLYAVSVIVVVLAVVLTWVRL